MNNFFRKVGKLMVEIILRNFKVEFEKQVLTRGMETNACKMGKNNIEYTF